MTKLLSLITLLLLCSGTTAFAQADLSSPEAAIASYVTALEKLDWERAAEILPENELERFAERLDLNFEMFSDPEAFIANAGLPASADRQAIKQMLETRMLDPDRLADYFETTEHYDELSDRQKFVAYLRYASEETQAPFLYNFQWETNVLGAVPESDTLAHGVIKQIIRLAETRDGQVIAESESVDMLIISVLYDGKNWRPQLGDHVLDAVQKHFATVALGM